MSYVPVGDGPQDLLVCPPFEKLYVGHCGMTNMVYVVRDRLGVTERHDSHPLADDRLAATLVSERYRYRGAVPAVLTDAAGRSVLRLRLGENDVSRLPIGVYVVVGLGAERLGKVVKME